MEKKKRFCHNHQSKASKQARIIAHDVQIYLLLLHCEYFLQTPCTPACPLLNCVKPPSFKSSMSIKSSAPPAGWPSIVDLAKLNNGPTRMSENENVTSPAAAAAAASEALAARAALSLSLL